MKSDECKSTVVYWHSQVVDDNSVALVADAMKRFAEEVTRQVGTPISVCKLPDKEGAIVNELLSAQSVTDQENSIFSLSD